MILKQKESLDWGRPIVDSSVVGGAPGYGFHSLPGSVTLPISKSASSPSPTLPVRTKLY